MLGTAEDTQRRHAERQHRRRETEQETQRGGASESPGDIPEKEQEKTAQLDIGKAVQGI